MVLFKKINDLRNWLDTQAKTGKSIGFVPTMGALHEGHLSLIKASGKENDLTVCSIFVNPTQFNDPGDFDKYPITIEKDIDLLEECGCDLVFLPSVQEMYPPGFDKNRTYDLGQLEKILEGEFRPGHFQGVCMIVERLLNIVRPRALYLGQKDYQQCMVIDRLINLVPDLPKPLLRICPTLREPGGLAMSSRNMRLDQKERQKALAIFQALSMVKREIRPGDLSSIKQKATQYLIDNGFRVDYVAIADAKDLSLADHWNGQQKLVVLIAAFMGDVRLIDNMVL